MNDTITILGTRINLETYDSAVEKSEKYINSKNSAGYVTLTCVDSVVNAYKNPLFKKILNESFLSLPDGLPLVWIARSRGIKNIHTNTRGTSLMCKFIENTCQKQYKHYFYGGKEGIAVELKRIIENKFKGVQIVGTYCPPFKKITEDEDKKICEVINSSGADIVWVGLGAPKQELWMYEHRDKLNVSLMIGVGAAFDFLSGNKKEAPAWMKRIGLEWLYRLMSEPRRLWKRYLVGNSLFIYWLIKEKFSYK
ncbi:MAG: WecB/TagA/CpsF family glycosyltransferase [Sedimentisphaerales bacterium]|nr:WecB/TagA/CpsF family glycosyltransferase [Sedimentisphaerales bacterium]